MESPPAVRAQSRPIGRYADLPLRGRFPREEVLTEARFQVMPSDLSLKSAASNQPAGEPTIKRPMLP